jgi:ketosteroid isomerase-like protein
MSEENVQRFMEATDAFNRRDFEAWLGVMDPEVQFEPVQAALEGNYVGGEGAKRWLADATEHYRPGVQIHLADVRDLGDRVLALGTLHFVGMGSGIETDAPLAILAKFRDGLVIHLKDYGDKEKALEAAGLSE